MFQKKKRLLNKQETDEMELAITNNKSPQHTTQNN